MFDRDRWQEIYSTLKSNKLRTFMTAFGVFWGIFMLIIMMGSGNGLENSVFDGFQDYATNSAFIWTRMTTMPYKGLPRGRWWLFDNDDMKALKDNIQEIDLLAPRVQPWAGETEGGNNVVRGIKTASYTIVGDYPAFFRIDPVYILQGREINDIDIIEKRKVAVIGNRVRDEMFDKDEDPIGEYIRIRGVYFQVVGVFEPKNKNMNFGGDKEATIILPFTSLQIAYNLGDEVHYFAVTAKKNKSVADVEKKCMQILAERNKVHPEDERAFGHFNLDEEFRKMSGLFTGIRTLVWIVGIGTLLAGVIGVSNIMLIVVKERTKEIGIQRSIGATPWRIINQIIMESVVLTSSAGMFGLAIGAILLELLNYQLVNSGSKSEMFLNPGVDFKVAMTALVVLIFAGIFAGFIPARKAVSIKPVEALHAE
ncbi:MAG: ABC transporter permease [Bacteroidales bacterium]|nr:ABC transporter permease [Bacteroidales bacterium]